MLFNQFLLKVLKETQCSGEKGNGFFPFYKPNSKPCILAHPNPMCLGCTVPPALSNMLGHAAGTKSEGPTKCPHSQWRATLLRSSHRPEMDAQRKVRAGQMQIMAPKVFYRGSSECDVSSQETSQEYFCGLLLDLGKRDINLTQAELLSLCEG